MKKPKKPSKNDSPPLSHYEENFYLDFNCIGRVGYFPCSKYDLLNNEEIHDLDMDKGRENSLTKEVLSQLPETFERIQKENNISITDFRLMYETDHDGYFSGWYIECKVLKEPDIQRLELEIFKNRFATYEEDMKKYLKFVEDEKKFRIEMKKKELEDQLKKLKNEI